MDKPKCARGRPTKYNIKLAEEICRAISISSIGVRKLCELNPHWPTRETIRDWTVNNDAFSALYIKAKAIQVSWHAEDCIEIADDSGFDAHINESGKVVCDSEAINRARLRVDTRKWLASKLAPKIYGDAKKNDDIKDAKSLIEDIIDNLPK